MRVQTGVITVATAGTAVVTDNTANRVYEITFKALPGNSGLVYVGTDTVSAATGFELSPGQEKILSLKTFGGSIPLNLFYANAATDNDKVSWIAILEG